MSDKNFHLIYLLVGFLYYPMGFLALEIFLLYRNACELPSPHIISWFKKGVTNSMLWFNSSFWFWFCYILTAMSVPPLTTWSRTVTGLSRNRRSWALQLFKVGVNRVILRCIYRHGAWSSPSWFRSVFKFAWLIRNESEDNWIVVRWHFCH